MRSILRLTFACLTIFIVSLATLVAVAAAKKTPPASASRPEKSLLEGVDLYQIDAAHSPIEFSVAFMGVSHVRGVFPDYSGTIAIDRGDITRSSLTVVIRTKSLTTFNALRDRDLKGPDWFDVEKYPVAVFRSHDIAKAADGYVVHGTLSLHGVTHEVEMPMASTGRFVGPTGDEIAGFEGHAVLKRKDYGIVGPSQYNDLRYLGKAMVGEDIELPLTVESFRAPAKDSLADPVADSLWRSVVAKGVQATTQAYRSYRSVTPDSLRRVTEPQINAVGIQLVEHGRSADALELFKLQVESYPQSASGQSGLAYAYATLGDSANATGAAEKALQLNPAAARALEILRRVRSGSAS